MVDIKGLQGALHDAQQARIEAQLAGCEMEELAAVLHQRPPVGRWPAKTRSKPPIEAMTASFSC